MKTWFKQELVNDILTGLLVAATFAAAAPTDALAQLSTAVGNAQSNIMKPAIQVISYIAYAFGAVLVVTGISGAKKHADAPANNPLGPAIGKLGAGAALLAAPSVVGMLQQTGNSTLGSGNGTFNPIGGF